MGDTGGRAARRSAAPLWSVLSVGAAILAVCAAVVLSVLGGSIGSIVG
jgi:hypothetical protein